VQGLHGGGGQRRRFESKYMDADEIDSILRIQWRSLHSGPPYIEDFYYQVGISRKDLSSSFWRGHCLVTPQTCITVPPAQNT